MVGSLEQCDYAIVQHRQQEEHGAARRLDRAVRSLLWVVASVEAGRLLAADCASLACLAPAPGPAAPGARHVVASLTGFVDVSRSLVLCTLRALGAVASKSMHVALTTHLVAAQPGNSLGGPGDSKLVVARSGVCVGGEVWSFGV